MSNSKKTIEKTDVKKTSFLKSPAHLLLLAVIFIILLISGIYLQQHPVSNPTTYDTQATAESANRSLAMTANNQTPNTGDIVKVSVWEDSGNQPVNAVQASIEYPANKFTYVSSDGSRSAFEIQAQNTGKDGKIVIARGHKGSLTGRQLVAVVSLKTKNGSGNATLRFNNDTHLVSADTNQDILKQSNDLIFSAGN